MMVIRPAGWVGQLLAAVAVAITVADGGIYLWLISQQRSDAPAGWFVAGLCAAILLGAYGILRKAPWQGAALRVGGAILVVLGVLGILSVGMPLLGAGLLLWIAAAREGWRHSLSQPASKPRQG